MKGLIIIGYQGIGKSSIGGWDDCVDLESSSFYIDGKRDESWCDVYCRIAINIASQGYTVFTSSHKVVREKFKSMMAAHVIPRKVGKIVIFCPDKNMKEDWIKRLEKRYMKTKLEKDIRALRNAEQCYEQNIHDLVNDVFPVYQPSAIDYDLKNYVAKIRHDWCM